MRWYILLFSLCIFSCTPDWSEVEFKVETNKGGYQVITTNNNGGLDTNFRYSNKFDEKFWLEKDSEVTLKIIAFSDSINANASISWNEEILESQTGMLDSSMVLTIQANAE